MVNKQLRLKFVLSLFTLMILSSSYSQKLGFNKLLLEDPEKLTTFCVPNTAENLATLAAENKRVKYSSNQWLFITVSPRWIDASVKSGGINDFYFEYAPPSLLTDTSRVTHFVEDVHTGSGGLGVGYTGKNVVIGYVDTGIDWQHPDFMNPDSTTRVYRYWDHSVFTGTAPLPYGYGSVGDSASIDDQTILSIDNNVHGSTVAGAGSGNGFANGTNKGMAPNSKIVIVETNFNLPNWTLTVADACDYIFSIADSLGMPCVINLSLGSYLGSHDGNDPASIAMEAMLDAKPGRIIVAAAGNSGNQDAYHQHTTVNADTSFIWLKNNPSGAFGANTIFFDLWSDVADATFDFGFAADTPSPGWNLQGETNFYGATSSLGSVIYDTIWNGLNRLATVEVYTNIISGAYNMQVLFSNVDSTNYLYRFRTTGTGEYDMWSGAWLGLNDFETTLPTVGQMPDIAYYVMPDTLQTIVSAWNCSEKVISVANSQNRMSFIDGNLNTWTDPNNTPSGALSPSSSKGPSRLNVIKPDITASGEVTLGAALAWMQLIPFYYPSLDSGLWHYKNSGTSMAAPIVAGIAALYLEKCPKATYTDFLADITSTAFTDTYTGVVPNNSFGAGKINALDLLLSTNFISNITGPAGICDDATLDVSSSVTIDSVLWSNSISVLPMTTTSIGDYSAIVYDARGCKSYTDTVTLIQYIIPTIDPIVQLGDTLSTTASDGYQWTVNGTDIGGETNSTLTIVSPFGSYACYTVSTDGCIAFSDTVVVTVGLDELVAADIHVYPNPATDILNILSKEFIKKVSLISIDGKIVQLNAENGQSYDLTEISQGSYTLIIQTEKGIYKSKITRI